MFHFGILRFIHVSPEEKLSVLHGALLLYSGPMIGIVHDKYRINVRRVLYQYAHHRRQVATYGIVVLLRVC